MAHIIHSIPHFANSSLSPQGSFPPPYLTIEVLGPVASLPIRTRRPSWRVRQLRRVRRQGHLLRVFRTGEVMDPLVVPGPRRGEGDVRWRP